MKCTRETVPVLIPPRRRPYSDYSWHWLHAERASTASIAQWTGIGWACAAEAAEVSPAEMYRRGWEYLGPVTHRPRSAYLDRP